MSNEITIAEDNQELAQATVAERLQMVAAINAAQSLNEYTKENGTDSVFTIKEVYITEGVRKARGAQQVDTPCFNTYLILDTGECLMTQSDGIYRSVKVILAAFPTLDLGDGKGIPVRVEQHELKNGNTIKSLVPVVSA